MSRSAAIAGWRPWCRWSGVAVAASSQRARRGGARADGGGADRHCRRPRRDHRNDHLRRQGASASSPAHGLGSEVRARAGRDVRSARRRRRQRAAGTSSSTSRTASASGPTPCRPTPVTLDQNGCQYVPHVIGAQVGQTIKVANSDVGHAQRPRRAEDQSRVQLQPAGQGAAGGPRVHRPGNRHPGQVRRARLDERLRQRGAASVLRGDDGDDGSFEIKGLPPGTYTVEAWHETLGTQTQSVTVDGKTPATVTAAFKPAT